MASHDARPENGETDPVTIRSGKVRLGNPESPAETRMLVGHCCFESPDAALLVSLLPRYVYIRGEERLTRLVKLLDEESRTQRPAREIVLARLLEVLFIEALRSHGEARISPGLMCGLADASVARAIQAIHQHPARAWTTRSLATRAALSRSAFFERLKQKVGVTPMSYLLTWRMALAKQMLRRDGSRIADIAEQVGYGSTSAFSVAFTRHVGLSPGHYARGHA